MMNALSAKAAATREKILRTADELFYLRGYNATGLDATIGAAGVTKNNFYYYVKSKEQLAVEVIEWHFDKVQAEMRSALSSKRTGPLERLFTILDVILTRHKAQYTQGHICGCLFGNFTLELSTDSRLARKKLNDVFRATAGFSADYWRKPCSAGKSTNTWKRTTKPKPFSV